MVRIAALMKKGLRLRSCPACRALSHAGVRIAALMKKGLRLPRQDLIQRPGHSVRIAALMKKGLRRPATTGFDRYRAIKVRIAALMKKGLRPMILI